MVASEGVHIGVSIVLEGVVAHETSLVGRDVRVSSSAIGVVMKSFTRASLAAALSDVAWRDSVSLSLNAKAA